MNRVISSSIALSLLVIHNSVYPRDYHISPRTKTILTAVACSCITISTLIFFIIETLERKNNPTTTTNTSTDATITQECPICLEIQSSIVTLNPCTHKICSTCAHTMYDIHNNDVSPRNSRCDHCKKECPICRTKIQWPA